MSKEELIKEVWGKNYNKDVIMKGRRCGFKIITNMEFISTYKGGDWYCEPDTWETIAFMPTSLRQILNNNGWVKIESEEDLPNTYGFYHFTWIDATGKERVEIYKVDNKGINCPPSACITHYQPIEKPKPPIF